LKKKTAKFLNPAITPVAEPFLNSTPEESRERLSGQKVAA